MTLAKMALDNAATAPDTKPVDFFISRRGSQASVAQEVAEILNGAGYSVLVQDFDIPYSANFITAMHFALKRARHLVVLLTRDYDQSDFTLAEVSNFLAAAARSAGERRLIVLRVDHCEPEGIFAGIVYADLVGVTDPHERRARVIAAAEGRPIASPRGQTVPSHEMVSRLSSIAAASTFAGKIEAFLEEYLITEEGSGAVPFAGRNEELNRLDQWLDDSGTASRFVLTAPAGRGKSALAVHWMERLESKKQIGDASGSWSLVFVPISMRFNTNRPEVFYEAIAARLADVLGESLKPAHLDPAAYYQDQCRLLLNQAIKSQKRILLVVDGLDEALGERFDVSWFPRAPGPYLRLLVTARLQVGDQDSRGWVTRLGWISGSRVQTRELPTLDIAAVRELLLTSGAQIDVLGSRPEVVTKLHALAEGEPLLLRLYVESLWQQGDEASRLKIEDLDHIQAGFNGYFEDWLERQRRAWDVERQQGTQIDEQIILAHLAVLACAYGPLTSEELSELVRQVDGATPGFRTENALYPLRRFVIGTGRRSKDRDAGYVLSHPKFGEYLRNEYFDERQVKRVQGCFANWGRETLLKLNSGNLKPENVPVYLLQNLNQHFNDTAATLGDIMQFAEEGWLRAWEAFEGGYRGYSLDILRAAEVASDTSEQGARSFELRCRLILSSISSIGSMVDTKLIVAGVQRGILPLRTALHWAEYRQGEDRATIVIGLAPLLAETDREDFVVSTATAIRALKDENSLSAVSKLVPILPSNERDKLISWALSSAAELGDNATKVRIFADLASVLENPKKAEVTKTAWEIAETLSDNDLRATCLEKITAVVSPNEQSIVLRGALNAARMIRNGGNRARRLASLATRLSESDQLPVILEALASIASCQQDKNDEFFAAIAFRNLAPLLPMTHVEEAFLVARSLKENANKGFALANLASRLNHNEQISILTEARDLVHKSKPVNAMRVYALVEIAKRLDGSEQVNVLRDSIAATKKIFFPPYGVSCLASVADVLPDSLLAEILSISIAIDDVSDQAPVLAAVASLLPEPESTGALTQAIAIAKEIANHKRMRAFCGIVEYLPEDRRANVLNEALSLDDSFDSEEQVQRQIEIAKLIPDIEREGILKDATIRARAIDNHSTRASMLSSLVPLLRQEDRAPALEEILVLTKAINNESSRVDVLLNISEHLPEDVGADLFEEAITAARTSKDLNTLALGCAARSRVLRGEKRADAIAEALAAAQEAPDDWRRGNALVVIAKAMEERDRTIILPILVENIHYEGARALFFERLLEFLNDSQIIAAKDAIRSFKEDGARAEALAALVPRLSGTDRDEALSLFVRIAHKQTRYIYLRSLRKILPTLAKLEGLTGLKAVQRSILDVCRWFH